jgi:hypothetical protein
MKQTAVEWLEKIRQGQKGQPFDDYEWEIAFNHAKEMEKEQVIKAYEYTAAGTSHYGEQYYNETFNK